MTSNSKTLDATDHRQCRAHLLACREAGKPLRSLRKDVLYDEMIVVLGPNMSPNDVIGALTSLAKTISNEGMLIGYKEPEGDLFVESCEGNILP